MQKQLVSGVVQKPAHTTSKEEVQGSYSTALGLVSHFVSARLCHPTSLSGCVTWGGLTT